MTQPENYTAAQASDPQTPAQTLADIAAMRPDLRPAVAANPSAYPALLEWLKSLGEPAVDAALASREQATQVLPQQPAPPVAAAPVAPQQPAAPQEQAWAAAPPPGAPAPMAPPGVPGYGAPVPGGVPGYAGAAPEKSNKTLWIVLAIIGVLIIAGGLITYFLIKANDDKDDVADDIVDIFDDPTPEPTAGDPMRFGDDPELDALYLACEGGDWVACDDLYDSSPIDSEYFAFGDTCGGAWTSGTTLYCVEAMAEPESTDLTDGETIWLEALSVGCAAGEWWACDDLYWDSPLGSDYEEFGDTCGGRTTGLQFCVDELGGGVEPENMTRGSSITLDLLWDSCAGGSAEACDVLYWESPIGSEYESFAQDNRW